MWQHATTGPRRVRGSLDGTTVRCACFDSSVCKNVAGSATQASVMWMWLNRCCRLGKLNYVVAPEAPVRGIKWA
eukprot:13599649-Alexandrium_andersonii.AAC.1